MRAATFYLVNLLPVSLTGLEAQSAAVASHMCVCILVKHDICLACLALTCVKLWLIPPVALYLHGKEETAVMLGVCAQAEAFDVPVSLE